VCGNGTVESGEDCDPPGPDSSSCSCPIDACLDNDYYDYPAYGDCTSSCLCDTGAGSGQPCAPTISYNDPSCISVSPPTVTNSTGDSNVTSDSARLNGEVTATGGEGPTVRIYWGDNDGVTNPTNWDNVENLGIKGIGVFFQDISGLAPSTTYYYRCYASNSAGSDWANDTESLTTLSGGGTSPPTVTNNGGESNITSDSARLNGEVTATGGENPTVRIYWGDNDGVTNPANWDNVENLGIKGIGTFYYDASGLNPSTDYYYRSYAANSVGSDWANDTESLTTLSGGPICGNGTVESGEDCDPPGPDSSSCSCPIDACVDNDYYDYPAYGDCTSSCLCDTGAGSGQPCAPTISYNDPLCNQPPTAAISCDISQCSGGECNATWIAYQPTANPPSARCIYTLINNSTDQDSSNCPTPCNDDIAKSEWYLKKQGEPDSAYVLKLNCAGVCNYTLQNLAPANYIVKLYVEDSAGNSDSVTHLLTVRDEVEADFMCSLDNATWKDCENVSPFAGETVYFKDDPSLAISSNYSEGASAIVSRVWKKGDGTTFVVFASNTANPFTNLTMDSNVVRLTVTDNNPSGGRSDYQEYTLDVSLPLPKWREISPF